MLKTVLLSLLCVWVTLIGVARAHHPLARELLRSGALQKALDLNSLQQDGNLGEMFSSKKKDVVVSDLGNKILKVAGNLPNNGKLIIQGESYMELFDPQDIQNPMLLLQKIIKAKQKPVSVSLPVSDPYFIFSAPVDISNIPGTIVNTSKDVFYTPKSIGNIAESSTTKDTAKDINPTASSGVSKLNINSTASSVASKLNINPVATSVASKLNVNSTDSSAASNVNPPASMEVLKMNINSTLSSAASKSNFSPTASSEVWNMNDLGPSKALKLNRVKRHHPSILSSMLSRLQSYALVPVKTPTGATRYLLLKDPKFIVTNNKNPPVNTKPKVKIHPLPQPLVGSPQVQLPAPRVHVPAPVLTHTASKWMVAPLRSKTVSIGIMPPEAGGGGLTAVSMDTGAQQVTLAPNVQTVPPAPNTNIDFKAAPRPESQTTAPVNTIPAPQGTTNQLGAVVSKIEAIASGFAKPQEIVDFQNAQADAIQKLDAVIMNKAERQDVINFAKSLLNAMKLLNVVVTKHGERRDTAVFAQAMLSGLKRLDEIFKTGTKQQVVNYAKTMVDAIKLYDVEADPGTSVMKKVTEPPTTTTVPTTTITTDLPEEAPTTTEEYEFEESYTTQDYYYYGGAATASPGDLARGGSGGGGGPPTTPQPPPGVAGWKGGPTTEPALGPLDRINTTDVPEEIEARPDKTPAEKRRDFLEMNPHMRGKLPPLIPTKRPGVTQSPSKAPANKLKARKAQKAKINTNSPPAKTQKAGKKSNLNSLILRRKKKNPGNGKLKISGSRSTITAHDPYIPRNPLYRRWSLNFHRKARENPWIYLLTL